MAIGPTLDQIHSTLVSAFKGYKLSDGKFLSASTRHEPISGGTLPLIAFETGSFTMSPWQDFVDQLTWDIPATLTVQGVGEDGETKARQVVQDLILRSKQVAGLPIDEKGKLIPFGDKTVKLWDEEKLTFLTDRGAPYLKSARFILEQDGICKVYITFHVEAIMSLDQRQLPLMKVGVLGVNTVRPTELYQDATDGRGVAIVFGSPDEKGFGGYASGDPSQPGSTGSVAGSPPADLVAQVNVTPYAVSISAGTPTAQMTAIARFNNWATQYVTSGAAWATTDSLVATVSASGLVTRVGAGSCNIFCTYGGTVSNSVPVTSS